MVPSRIIRTCAVALTGTAAAARATSWGLDAAAGLGSPDYVDRLVGTAGLLLAVCAVWGWLTALLVVIERLRPGWQVPVVPGWLRRVVLAACGLALVAPTGPALATDGGTDPSLTGLPYPDRAVGTLAAEEGPAPDRIRVRAGDSLWAITAARLDARAPEIAVQTGRLYRLNRSEIGADPDLITPGQVLRIPSSWPVADHPAPQEKP